LTRFEKIKKTAGKKMTLGFLFLGAWPRARKPTIKKRASKIFSGANFQKPP
jgi:hypothetical protein